MNWGNVVNRQAKKTEPFTPRASDYPAVRLETVQPTPTMPSPTMPPPVNDTTVRRVDFPKPADNDAPLRDRPRNVPWGRPSARLLMPYDPFDSRSEKVRMLRTELVLRHEGREGANMMAMLSPRGGEGRSQVAAELAVAFAQLGRRTLLVDADLRRPSQHILFMAKNHLGLAQALARGEAPRLRPVDGLDALSIVTSGPTPRNPLELLSDRTFANLVEAWRTQFDYVVIDTPPAHYADALAIASVVQRVVALTRSGHTPYAETRDMLRRLTATGSEVLGAVINHF
jgi:protein-tyrosine kinase